MQLGDPYSYEIRAARRSVQLGARGIFTRNMFPIVSTYKIAFFCNC